MLTVKPLLNSFKLNAQDMILSCIKKTIGVYSKKYLSVSVNRFQLGGRTLKRIITLAALLGFITVSPLSVATTQQKAEGHPAASDQHKTQVSHHQKASKEDKTARSKLLQGIPHPNLSPVPALNLSRDNPGHATYGLNPFTGNFELNIPLIAVPLNDGLTLHVNVSSTNLHFFGEAYGTGNDNQHMYAQRYTPLTRMLHIAPGVIDTNLKSSNYAHKTIVFVDPTGATHVFYPNTSLSKHYNYYSTDGWAADFTSVTQGSVGTYFDFQQGGPTLYGDYFTGTIISPTGIIYHIAPGEDLVSRVTSIDAPHGGASITYTYRQNNYYASKNFIKTITASNGYTVTFKSHNDYKGSNDGKLHYMAGIPVIYEIETSGGKKWHFHYDTDLVFDSGWVHQFPWGHYTEYVRTLSSIDFPTVNGYTPTWQVYYQIPQKLSFPILQGVKTPTGLTVMASGMQKTCQKQSRFCFPYTSVNYSGAEISSVNIGYDYSSNGGQDNPATTTITAPYSQKVITYTNTYDNDLPHWQTGLPSKVVIKNPQGQVRQTTTYDWQPRLLSSQTGGHAPELVSKTITRGSASYTTTYSGYDKWGYPAKVTYGYDNTQGKGHYSQAMTYDENTANWIFLPLTTETYSRYTSGPNKGKKDILSTSTNTVNNNGEITQTDVNGVKTQYTYHEGDISSVTNARGDTTDYHDYASGMPQKVVQPITSTETATTQYVVADNGEIDSKTGPMGHTTTYTYASNYGIKTITPPTPYATTTYQYYANGKNETKIISGSLSTPLLTKTIDYNVRNQPTEIRTTRPDPDQQDSKRSVYQFKTYDQSGRLTFVSYPTYTNSIKGLHGDQYHYDALNRIISKVSDDLYPTLDLTQGVRP